jgi:hypothetical protein
MSDDSDDIVGSAQDVEVDDDEVVKKKGPGRPRKMQPHTKPAREGIVHTPTNYKDREADHHALELVYENPLMFRKIITLFKAYAVPDINMMFDKDRVYIYGVNPSGEVKIVAEIFCHNMNRYYLQQQHHIVLSAENFNKLFSIVNKDFIKIFFFTTQKYRNQRFWTMFTDEDDEESFYSIDLGAPTINPLGEINNILKHEQEYPISFELTFKALKRKIGEYGGLKIKKIDITQSVDANRGTRRLYFKCETEDHRIINESPFKNLAKINFISTTDDNDSLFTAPVFINNIKPLANTLIGEKVKFSVDEQRDLIFTTDLDYDIADNKKRIIGSEKCRVRVTVSLARTATA